jgi:mRNA interferase RelE/StbE
MKVSFDKSFSKRLIKIKDKAILERIKEVILQVEDAADLQQIPHIKKMEGFKTFYRIRIADYRIGLELKKDTIWFITVANRKDIYKSFP